LAAADDALVGQRRGARALLPFPGPAAVASIAYVDPGNFATNIEAGAGYGHELISSRCCSGRCLPRSGSPPPAILPMEILSAFVGVIAGSYLAELLIAPTDWSAIAAGAVTPRFDGAGAMLLACGIVGATIMPHAIYLHSGLTQDRLPVINDGQRRKVLRMYNREVLLALGLAGVVNMAMVATAAAAFRHGAYRNIAEIATAHQTLGPLLGAGAAGFLMAALLASGFASSIVGVMAGQVIMQGFVGFRIPLWVRRMLVMAPALVVVSAGVDATGALVLSQVVLSLVLPIPMAALAILTADRRVLADFANRRVVNLAAITATVFVLGRNIMLFFAAATGP
jgi:manganese transport protein